MPKEPAMSRTKRLRVGAGVVAKFDRLQNADPMDRLEVTAVHSDHTVDLRISDLAPDDPRRGAAWVRVDPDDLTVLG